VSESEWATLNRQRKAKAALDRLRGVDGLIGLNGMAMKTMIPVVPKTGSAEDLARSIPDLLDVAIWAYYELQLTEQA